MRNVTISVSDELKTEMDTLSEVNWSEICRKAITQYIAERKNPTPNIEISSRNSRLTASTYDTGYPTLSMDIRIHNKMNSEITIDRVLSNVTFFHRNQAYHVGTAHSLYKRTIADNSIGGVTIHLPLLREKIRELKDSFDSTFDCHVRCTVYVEGFRNEYNGEVRAQIPIDVWKSVVKEVLTKNRVAQD